MAGNEVSARRVEEGIGVIEPVTITHALF
ncbi:MAG: hypothetical protein JWO91_1308, partial [Acidobacteriaceae bacterium]|nr:hypothetical protein [Acidobacteriaceae bacterium]